MIPLADLIMPKEFEDKYTIKFLISLKKILTIGI